MVFLNDVGCRSSILGDIGRLILLILRQDLVEDLRYSKGVLDAFVDHETQYRCVSRIYSIVDFLLQEPGRTVQPMEAKLLFLFVAHDRHVHFGLSQVGSDFDECYGDILYTWVPDFGQDRHGDDFAYCFSNFEDAT